MKTTSTRSHPTSGPDQIYAQRAARFAAERDAYAARWSRVANWRLAAFTVAAACAGLGWWRNLPALLWLSLALGLAFLGLVAYHNRLGDSRRRSGILHDLNAEGLLRLARDWAALPLRRPPGPPPANPTAYDLDLLGEASLQHLLNTPQTPSGVNTLQAWLLAPAPPETARARQEAVAELAPLIDLRDGLALSGRLAGDSEARYAQLITWAAAEPWLKRRPALRWLCRISPALFVAGLVAQLAGLTPLPLWLPFFALNLLLSALFGRRAMETVGPLLDRQDLLGAYIELVSLAAGAPLQAGELRRIQIRLTAGEVRADLHLRRLRRIALLAEYQRSILFPLLQFGLLWSFLITDLAEGWRAAAGKLMASWLDALGELEALSALAALRHDHPGWAFPSFCAEPLITAQSLGHPLLPPERAVVNDVGLGPPGSFLLITGSNMSGKSTLLRAIGVNIVLAQAGGPVCAAALELPPVSLATSMRVQDSLAQGVSYFMAELRRLKQIVEQAEASRAAGTLCCYLLDEILHGTNSVERQIAARRVISYLVGQSAVGAVSTHDLALAADPALAEAARLAHFSEQFVAGPEGDEMRFDYKLRPGLATTTNALRLMALVGLPG